MTSNASLMRLRIHELEGKIIARQRLADQARERDWHLRYVEIYTAEKRRLQTELLLKELTATIHSGLAEYRELSASRRPASDYKAQTSTASA